MFSQRDEEKYILQFFRETKGRFLDIGAYDGKCFSTTHALALKGWSGVCVEPSPSVFPALQRLYQDNLDVKCLELAITDTSGEVDFYDSGGDLVSSVDLGHVQLWQEKGGCRFKKIKVASQTMFHLLEIIGYDFDFISLDVEGTNLSILKQFPFDRLKQTKMLCVEFESELGFILKLVKPFGFGLLHHTAENLLLTR